MAIQQIFSGNVGTFTKKEQEKIQGSKFCIVGLGGAGSYTLECILRAGVEKIIVFDNARLDYPDFNRNLFSTSKSLGNRKVHSALNRALEVNPKILFKPYTEDFTEFSIPKAESSDLFICCTENPVAFEALEKISKKRKKPVIVCSVEEMGGFVSVYSSQNKKSLASLFSKKKKSESISASACMFGGALAASQAINIILKKNVFHFPQKIEFDLFSKKLVSVKRMK
ncbi:ThiF family adenylyltransferase [Candidatus Micrarchaeota archaeon]|nr:ThiF family adenylyltransferase [Candidatus Micrarchaeota archaeon]